MLLRLAALTPEDSGEVRCEVRTALDSLRSAPAFLWRKMKVKKSGLRLIVASWCCQLTLSSIKDLLSTLRPVSRKPLINSWK